jgi:hypothetical protein
LNALKEDKEARKVKLFALLLGVAAFLLLALPYLSQDFLSSALYQPVEELKSLENVSYTAQVFPQNSSIVINVRNPASFAVTVLNVSGPGVSSTQPVTIPPQSNGIVVLKIYNYREALKAYSSGNFYLTVTLHFLNATVAVTSR